MSKIAELRVRLKSEAPDRHLDRDCAEALGWRVSHDPWWNWSPGPVFEPEGDEWCIRKDGRKDIACNEALPSFTLEIFDAARSQEPDQ